MDLSRTPPERRVPTRDLRASDADRERVVAVLREAHGDGRLSIDEHAERVERAYAARTLGELIELTADLIPADQQPIRLDAGAVHALFGTARRGGRWVVPVRLPVSALFGTVEIDLREALLFGGRLRLLVPEGVRVEFTGRSMIGVRDLRTRAPRAEDAPLVEVRGTIFFGSVIARAPKRRWRDRLPRRGDR